MGGGGRISAEEGGKAGVLESGIFELTFQRLHRWH